MTNPRLFDRAIIRLSPLAAEEDVVDFLQGLVTNDVAKGLPTYCGMLTAQGKAMFDFIVWGDKDGAILLDCEADVADALVKRLSIYRLRRKIAIARDDMLGVFWQADGDQGTADPRLTALGQRWISTIDASDSPADDAWRQHRLGLGVPEGAAELGDVLWLETNAVELHGVSFDKGCYIGQENTARMNWRQKVNRRLVVVPADRSDAKRRIVTYPDLGLAVDHLRLDAIDTATLPDWQAAAFTDQPG